MALRPIGSLIQADKNGVLPRLGEAPHPSWDPILTDLVRQIDDNTCTICLRGSVARGADTETAADLDLVIIYDKGPIQPLHSGLMPDLDIETVNIPRQTFLTDDCWVWMRFALAHGGTTIQGPDLLQNLPAPQLGHHCFAHLRNTDKWLTQWQSYWKEDEDHAEICQWLMKRIIRALFESQMMKLNAYSRDIYPCTMAAIDAFPDAKVDIMQAAELAIAPTTNQQTICTLASRLAPFFRHKHRHGVIFFANGYRQQHKKRSGSNL